MLEKRLSYLQVWLGTNEKHS